MPNQRFRIIPTLFLAFVLQAIGVHVTAQSSDTLANKQPRVLALSLGGGLIYSSTMVGLNELWYKDFPRSSFHSFNDNAEWLQIDKAGHFMTSYYLGLIGHQSLSWAGAKEKRALIAGGLVGTMFLSGIEVLDGFSTEWGFSWGDMAANLCGSGFYIGQEYLWHEQRIKLKFSSSSTHFAKIRPSILGSSGPERIFKDYNGQTYWASVNISAFIPESKIPKWLNIALGYGGTGMVKARMSDEQDMYHEINQHRRQYYLSIDLDLSKIKTKSRVLYTLSKAFGFIKIPAPTIEWNQQGKTNYYWLFF